MESVLFISILGLLIFGVLFWGFRTLPKEKWQMVAALPKEKNQHGQWTGLNLTWYGLLSANAYTFGVAILIVLAASAGIHVPALVLLTVLFLAVTIPSSKIIARLVEKKAGTLTVGGAVFAGALTAPWIIVGVNRTFGEMFGFTVPVLMMLSAISIGYTFGEGLGRLACLSFGCCYGKPLCQCSQPTQKLFSRFYVVFSGDTKKAAYADGFDGEKMLPIQIITAGLYSITGLLGTLLFLNGFAGTALILTILVTQVWRVVSEFFRADFRGTLSFSWYQIMALCAVFYMVLMRFVFPVQDAAVDLGLGLSTLWHPGMILFLQMVWILSFLHSGRSSVTDSRIVFNVVRDKI